MNIELQASNLSLARDGMIAVRDARGVRITCLTGVLWVTHDNYAKDFIVGPGESHVIDYPGLTLVTALEPTTLSMREASVPLLRRIGNAVVRRLATRRQPPAAGGCPRHVCG